MAELGAMGGHRHGRRQALRVSLVGAIAPEDVAYVLAPADPVEANAEEGKHAALTIDGQPRFVELQRLDDQGTADLIEATEDGTRRTRVRLGSGRTSRHDGSVTCEVVIEGWRLELRVEDAARAALRERATAGVGSAGHGGPVEVRAIIPGRVVAVFVTQGDSVQLGQQLLVVEAMKMQNEVRAPRAGVVERVATAEGQTVDLGDLLVVLT